MNCKTNSSILKEKSVFLISKRLEFYSSFIFKSYFKKVLFNPDIMLLDTNT